MSTKFEDSEKTVSHPLEEVLDIEENTTVVPYKKASTDLVLSEKYDQKDNELDGQFQEVYDAAFEAFENQSEEAELIDPKYKARNAEVAVQYLNTALQAAREKSNLKQHADKIVIASKKGPSTVNNNLIVDRNELLRTLAQGDDEEQPTDVVDAEFTDDTEDDEHI